MASSQPELIKHLDSYIYLIKQQMMDFNVIKAHSFLFLLKSKRSTPTYTLIKRK